MGRGLGHAWGDPQSPRVTGAATEEKGWGCHQRPGRQAQGAGASGDVLGCTSLPCNWEEKPAFWPKPVHLFQLPYFTSFFFFPDPLLEHSSKKWHQGSLTAMQMACPVALRGYLTGQYSDFSPKAPARHRYVHPGCQPCYHSRGECVQPSDHLKFKRNPGLLVSVSRA